MTGELLSSAERHVSLDSQLTIFDIRRYDPILLHIKKRKVGVLAL